MPTAQYQEALATLIAAAGGEPGRLSGAQHHALRSRVRAFLSKQFNGGVDVDDLADEAITRFLVACNEGQVDSRRNPDAYLLRIAKNAALGVLRDQREEDVGDVQDFDDPTVLDAFAAITTTELIDWLFTQLRAARDVESRRVLAAARDIAYAGSQPSVRSVAKRAEIPVTSTYRAVLRIRALLASAEVERAGP